MQLFNSLPSKLCACALGCLFSAMLVACSGGSGTGGNGSAANASHMLLTSTDGGASQLGALTDLPPAVTDAAASFASFDGTPWIDNVDGQTGHGLVFNSFDNKFYAVLDGSGADKLGVLISFDPATDTIATLKSFVRRSYPSVTGVNGETFAFEPPNGFLRRPLLSPDGKSLLLRASYGGVDDRGALIHLNLDPNSVSYLQDSLVYSFFDYEKSQGSYCNSLRANGDSHISEMAWGKNAAGDAVVYMAVNGLNYDISLATNPTEPGNCAPYSSNGKQLDRINGRMFALGPSDASDLSKPWTYINGYAAFDPNLALGRQIYWDTKKQAIRWTTETVGGGELDFYDAGNTSGALYFGAAEQCFRLHGMLPLNLNGDSIAMCSGLNGSTTQPDSPPRIFHYTSNAFFTQQAALNNYYSEKKFIRGATSSLVSRRLFINGGDYSDDCASSVTLPCTAASTLEELDPATGYFQRVLVRGDTATTGRMFLGDPAVGSAMTEPMADRYVVWFGAMVKGSSAVLNKYDRATGQTKTFALDPKNGAYPAGPLLDLGNGQAMGRLLRTAPQVRSGVTTALAGIGGYAGGAGTQTSTQGYMWIDLKTKQVLRTVGQDDAILAFSQERVKLDDGTVWEAIVYNLNDGFGDYRAFNKVDLTTGKVVGLKAEQSEAYSFPREPFALAGRSSAALYLPFWKANADTVKRYADTTLACMRTDSPTAYRHSDTWGPAQATFGNAHRMVYGATYSASNKAMYLATAKVADADQGTIFEVDKNVADADLCKAKPVITTLVSGLTDVPSTKILAMTNGTLVYGTSKGRLMQLDVSGKRALLIADLKASTATSSLVKGHLSEVGDKRVAAVVFDYNAAGQNTTRRVVSVDIVTGTLSSRDVSQLIRETETYPGVTRLN